MLKGNPISLVLLPGLDGTGILFQPLIDALPPNIKPIVVGYPTDRPMTYAQLLPMVMAALPANEPFILLGESFSGPLAVMAAAQRPANLLGLILCATFVTRPMPWIGWAVPLLARSLVFQLFPPAQKVKAILGGYSGPALQRRFSKVHSMVCPAMIAFRVRQVFQIDVREELRQCDLPMLHIAAANDRVVPARNLRLIRQIAPAIQLATIEGPHGILQTRPAEAVAAIVNFVAALDANNHPVST
jgi:pimeloyl-ACP methyl ester carboxylesterase